MGPGSYLKETLQPLLPPGRSTRRDRQELVGGDVRLTAGPFEAHVEWVLNRYDSPFIPEKLEGFDLGARLRRERSYARSGQVLDVAIDKGVAFHVTPEILAFGVVFAMIMGFFGGLLPAPEPPGCRSPRRCGRSEKLSLTPGPSGASSPSGGALGGLGCRRSG